MDLHAALLEGLRAAAAGAFTPRFYQVRVSPRHVRRYRRPGMGSPLTPAEARAVQAFHYFGGCSITDLARRFHRNRRTIRKAIGIRVGVTEQEPGGASTWTSRQSLFGSHIGVTTSRELAVRPISEPDQ